MDLKGNLFHKMHSLGIAESRQRQKRDQTKSIVNLQWESLNMADASQFRYPQQIDTHGIYDRDQWL